MSNDFWSTLNKKKKEELLKSTQTKVSSSQTSSSSVSKPSEELKTSDFWSALSPEKQNELLSRGTTISAPTRTFMQDDDDIAPVLGNTGANKSTDTVETTQAIYDKYGQYYNSPDYDEYSKQGAAIKNPTLEEAEGWLTIGPWRFGNKEIGNIVTYSRDNIGKLAVGEINGSNLLGKTKYQHLTDFEVGIYNYLLAKEGKDSAQKFLDDIEETLNARIGGQIADKIQNSGAVSSAIMHGTFSVLGGMESFGTGVKQLFSEEALPTTEMAFTNQELLNDLDGFAKTAYQAGNTVGNMLPSVGASIAFSPAVGRILQSSSAAGNAYGQALKEGKTKEEAATFGVMMGSMEAVTSKLLGGAAGMTGDIPKKALSKIATFQNPLLKVAAKYGVNLASEVTEEELQLWLEPFARQIAFGEDYDAPTLEEMAETAIVTALSTGILNSSTDIATGNLTKVDGLTTNEAKVVDKLYNDAIAEKESDGKKLTKSEKDKLYDKVVEEMKRGYISTDEIESILGGKTYEGYKSLTEKQKSLEERKTAIESEIKDLVKTPESQFTVEQREKLTSLREEAKGIKEELQNLGIKTAKNNLFNEVNKLTSKDTFLRESYNDLARKNQAIEVDENQYKGTKFEDAAKKTIANARNAGANNSNRVRDFVEFSAKYSSVSGKVIDFKKDADIKGILENQLKAQIDTLSKSTTAEDKAKLAELQDTLKKVQEGEIRVNGVKTKDGVAININSSNYLNTVLGHEITHFLEKHNGYEPLQKAIFKFAQTKGDYEGRRKALEALYKNIDGTTVDYELTADLVGDYLFTEYDFIKNLSTENRNVFQQIYDQIKYMFKLATAGSKEARELEKVMHQFEKVLRESVETSQNAEHNEATTQFSLRTKPAPKKTQEVYKLMRLKDGEIYPLFIDSTEPLKVGEWYDADSPNLDFLKEMPSGVFLVDANNGTYQSFDEYLQESGERKTKYPSKNAIEKATAEGKRWVFIEDTAKAQKRFDGETRKYWNIGINGSGSVSTFSMRPGYHAGSLPTMRQIGKGANRDLRDDSFIWTVGEVPADIDYQAEAEMNPDKDIPTHIPEDGYYLKATNADKAKSQADRVGWYVAGAYKINRIISDSEARQVIDNWNSEHPDTPVEYDYDRESGMDFDADQMKLVPKSDKKNSISEDSEAEKGGVSYDETSESYSPVKYSLSTWNKSDYVFERKKAASDMAKTLGIAEEKALQYIDSVNSIAKMVADDQERLGYEASPGRSAFVSNAEYGGSIDFSTICKKRRLFTGTFEAIQNALPNTALTAEEVLEIRKMMKDKGYEVSCGLCYVEGSRANMGQFTKQFIERYKATNPEYVPNMAEMNTATGQEQIRKEHPEVYEAYEYFMNHYGKLSPDDKALFASQQKPKMYQMATEYKGEILDIFGNKESSVAEKNKNGGLRLQSFSDFEIIHLLDSMQVIMDMSRVGLAGQAYTKVPDFAWALGDTGLKINLSLIAKGVDENGRLILDDVEGMKESDAMALRDRYSDNVGTILVAFNDEQLKAAMADERIDYIIPYHRSQWKTSQYESMGLPENTKDYTAWQNESYIEPVYNKNGKKQRPSNYMPNTYWDFNKSGKENAEKYLQMCADNNRRPKFSHLLVDNGDGSYSLQPDGSTDGYWKTLIDFKMYNNDGIGVPQNPVTPDFNMEEAQRMLNEYKGGHAKFPVAKDIVEEFVSKHPDNIAPTENFSLSNEGENRTLGGSYRFDGKDFLKSDIAPVAEPTQTVEDTTFDAPMPSNSTPKSAQIANGTRGDNLLVESLDNYPMETMEQKIAEGIRAIESELADNRDLRKEAEANYNSQIAKLQKEYNSKKNKESKVAYGLLQSISRLERLKASTDAKFAKRISDLEARVEKMKDPQYSRAMYKKAKMEEHAKFAEDLIGDTSTWVDKKMGLQYAVNTERRNLRDIVRDENGNADIARADAINDALNGQYNRNQAERNRKDNEISKKYLDSKVNRHESVYANMLGELRHNPETTLTEKDVNEYYEKHKNQIDTKKVDKLIDFVRSDLDYFFETLNTKLREQGMKEIPYRKGYFPHKVEPKQNFIQKLLNWKTQDNEIPTSIAGLTEDFKPVKSYQSFDKQRHTDETDYDLMRLFQNYKNGALDWIYHLEDIQKRRAVENYIRYTHSEEGIQARIKQVYANEDLDADQAQAQIEQILTEAKNPLNNFVQDFTTHTNILAGKKNSLDRTTEQMTNRKIYSVMQNVQNRTSANMVLANVRSALTNFIPITQSWAQVSPLRSLQATKDTIANAIKDDGLINKSTFLTNRLREADSLYKTNWDKVLDKAGIMFEIVDNFSSQVIWRSKYNQNLANGMSEAEAIANADQFAENVMAGRSKGNEPTLFNAKNPLVKAFTMFQLEVNNQYGYFFKDVPNDLKAETEHWKLNLAKGYTTAFIGAYIYNALLEQVAGSGAALDPIGIIEDLLRDLGLFGDDEEEEPKDVLMNLVENVGGELPFVGGTLFGGGRIPISSALPYGDNGLVEGIGDFVTDATEGNWKNIGKELMNPILNVGLPVGGGQLKKTVQGLKMFSDEHPVSGSYTDSGNLRFPVEDTLGNRIQAGIFGQYASKNAREYFDNGYAPLKEKQIEEYMDVDLPIADYWKYREGLSGLKTNAEKADYINSLNIENWQKNLLLNNILDRKEDVDMSNYDDYNDWEEFDYATKNPDKYAFAKSVGGYSSYKTYSDALYDIKADKDENGKSISGSRKEKVINYLNNLDADYETKIILFKSEYPSDDTYNMEIINYINNRTDLTYEERVAIFTELGFTVSNGSVYWD